MRLGLVGFFILLSLSSAQATSVFSVKEQVKHELWEEGLQPRLELPKSKSAAAALPEEIERVLNKFQL